MIKTIRTGAIAATVAIALLAPAAVMAADNSRCWGTITSQRAVTYGDVGTHSSSFAGERRSGLANVAKAILGPDATLGDLGQLLGGLDDSVGQDPLGATSCP